MNMSEIQEKKTLYEFAYLLKLGKEQADVAALLKDFGMTVVSDGGVKNIELAYEIEKQASAQFGFYHIQTPNSDAISEMTKALNLRKDLILRFMFVTLPSEKKMAEGRSSREATPDTATTSPQPREEVLSNEKLEQSLEEILK